MSHGVEGLSLREKKELRKFRFNPPEGIAGASTTIDALQRKKEEEEKRLLRAQKFNLTTPETLDQKRQMRAVKFGLSSGD